MAKLYVENSDSKTIVKCKLDWLEQFRQEDIDAFDESIIRGLLKPAPSGFRTVEYYVPSGISLQQFLKRGLKKTEFFSILVQVLEVVKKVNSNGLTVNNICLDLSTTFINERTGEVYFVYAPIKEPKKLLNIKTFLSDMAYSTVFDLHEDVSFINNMVEYLNNFQDLSIQDIERYVMNAYPQVYELLNIDIKNVEETVECYSNESQQSGWKQNKSSVEANNSNDLEDLIRSFEEKTPIQNTPEIPVVFSDDEEEATVFLDDEATVFLDDETTELLEKEKKLHIYLIRIKNCEQIDINSPSFILGKDEYRANYAISDNGAVSRVHAEISCIEGRYFLRDNNSTNGTFVNDHLLEKGSSQEIFDGDEIVLGNEHFEFHSEIDD